MVDQKDYPLSPGASGGQRYSIREDKTGVAMTGEVKNIQDKGFGFILAEDHKEYFFHKTGFRGNWDELHEDVKAREKVQVEFEVDRSEKGKGPRAMNVERLDNR